MPFFTSCWLLLKVIARLLIDSLFPPFCCHCQSPFTYLCFNCYEQIDFLPIQPQLKIDPVFLDQIIIGGYFDGPLKSLILSLKYQDQPEVGVTIGQLLYHTVNIPPVDVVTWVPTHPRRLKDRGYNQAQLIAHTLAQEMGLPAVDTIQRSVIISPQAEVHNRTERLQRQTQTMELTPNPSVKSKTILVIDDVLTTGATLNETARVLKLHGALKVIGLAVAHAQ